MVARLRRAFDAMLERTQQRHDRAAPGSSEAAACIEVAQGCYAARRTLDAPLEEPKRCPCGYVGCELPTHHHPKPAPPAEAQAAAGLVTVARLFRTPEKPNHWTWWTIASNPDYLHGDPDGEPLVLRTDAERLLAEKDSEIARLEKRLRAELEAAEKHVEIIKRHRDEDASKAEAAIAAARREARAETWEAAATKADRHGSPSFARDCREMAAAERRR